MMRLSTTVTPGADQATRSASSFSAQVRTVPRRTILSSSMSTSMLSASVSALRTRAASIFRLSSAGSARRPGPDGDQVGDAAYAGEPLDDAFGLALLELPVRLAAQRDPAVGDGDPDAVRGHQRAPLQRPPRGGGDVGVGAVGRRRQPDLDVVGDCADAAHPLGRAFGRPSLDVAVRPAGQRHDAVLHGHADLVRLYAGVPSQLLEDIPVNLLVGSGLRRARHRRAPLSRRSRQPRSCDRTG